VTGSPDGPEPTAREPDARDERDAILSAAATLFGELGYHGASMSALAETAHTSKESVYHHFRAKHDILFALHDEWIDELLRRSQERISGPAEPPELMSGFAADVLSVIHERPRQVRVYFEYAAELPPELQARARAKRDAYEELVEQVLRAGMATGVFRDQPAEVATLAFFGLCNWAFMWYDGRGKFSHDEIAQQLSGIFLRGIATGSSP
jgi:AcrR family transcriptional regulator